ncbi:hypothetical protein B0A55_08984 [Friedmanniomyces simplex]|uniref:SHSP domain-containing protein n=1 Tax=Friedmanniomyces simplex TaxID=329884 RepID=A0A4U0WVL5_9PEZI|nr:hypothetical protein B0A55_08984 [Friedmanniomyces simplex]
MVLAATWSKATPGLFVVAHEAEKLVALKKKIAIHEAQLVVLKGKAEAIFLGDEERVGRPPSRRSQPENNTVHQDTPLTKQFQIPVLVNDAHERTHQHQPFLASLARHHPRPREYPNSPDVDIRDAGTDYLIDIEVPGIKSTADLHLHWMGNRGFMLTGDVRRPGEAAPEVEGVDPKDLTGIAKRNTASNGNGENGDSHKPKPFASPEALALPHLLIGERRLGFFKRVFTLPVEVEADKVSAKLEAGLLSLKVPKHHAAKGTGIIAIEAVE